MKFFKKVGAWIERTFLNVKKFIKNNVTPAIKFVNGIKQVVDNPALDIIVALTATQLDNKVLSGLRAALSKAIDILEIQLECGSLESDTDKIQCYINWLRTLPKVQRNAMYAKTASLIAQIHGGEDALKEHEVDLLVQLEYTENKITA